MCSVHLVIACWSGARRGQPYAKSYIPDQLEWLARTRHDIVTQVTMVDAHSDCGHPDHESHLLRAERLGICVIRRSNRHMSYGAYGDAFYYFGKQPFDYWIFIEDDYVFVSDDFDEALVDMHVEKFPDGNGYLCSMVGDGERWGRHGICSTGITTTHAARKAFKWKGREWFGRHQDRFTNLFGGLHDTTDRYMTIFYRGWHNRCLLAGVGSPLLVPVQCMGWPSSVFAESSGRRK